MAIVKKISELTPKGSNLGTTDLLIVGVDNGTDYDLKSVTGAQLLGTVVSQTITDGVTSKSPSENVVYDALALKVDKVAGSRLITTAEGTILSNTSGTNTGDETVTTIKTKLGITTLSGSNTGDQDLSGYVKTTTNQNIAGEKTFISNTTHDSGLRIKQGTTNYSIGYTGIGASANSLVIGNQVGFTEVQRILTFPIDANHTYTFPSLDGTIALTTDLTSKVDSNTAITGATKTKITYDSKGLVNSGADATTADIADSLNKRYVTDANLTVIGNTSGTNTGDQIISDATITTTDITTNNFTTAKHGFVPKGTNVGNFLKDDGTWGTPASGSSGGVVGIANASGVYTYYATLTLAMTAAVSGNTIELFSDITETGSVAITLKSGVKINGNGHTYTLSVNDSTNALICGSTVELFNWKVVRTGRSNGASGYTLYCYGGTLRAQGVLMENTYGNCVSDGIAIYGLNAKGYLNGFLNYFENPKHYECIGESTGIGDGILSTYSVNCTGIAVSGSGITGNGTHLNSVGISTSGVGMGGQILTGCIGLSTTGVGASASSEGRNCIGISTSGVGGAGVFYESTLISSSNYGCQATLYNSYAQSSSSQATNSSSVYNSTVRCLWNNVAGHCTSTNALNSKEILNSFLEVTNASAYCITGYIGSTWKYSNNSFKGATVAVNTTNITQGISNTHDNQGNILI